MAAWLGVGRGGEEGRLRSSLLMIICGERLLN